MRNDQHHVGLAVLYLSKSGTVGGLLSTEDEVINGLDTMDYLLRAGGTIVIDHIDHNILHFHIHHPRRNAHNHDGKHEYEFGQKRITANLQELLSYEMP